MAKKKPLATPETTEAQGSTGPTKKKQMTETELLSVVGQEVKQALGKMDTKLSNERLQAMKYYLGDKVGNLAPPEAEGRSTIVSMDVADTVEWILPSLIRIFCSGDDAVEFKPRKPNDVAGAQQATDWANYVFYVQNEGFIKLHDWFKDALLQKAGILKTWWDDSEDITTEEYENITIEELTLMMQDGTVEPIQQSQNPDGTYNVKVKKTVNSAHVCIENVPPEEWLVSRKARDSKRIFSCHHLLLRSVTELKERGYKNVDNLMSDDTTVEFSQEAIERQSDTNEFTYGSQFMQPADPSMRLVWITESYLQVDYDGDGLAEWRKVVHCGNVLLDNEEIDEHPFSIITPIKMPHKLIGRSVADMVMDLQDIKTALMRQFVDNMYIQNNPRLYVDETQKVNIDDLLDARVGGIVRGKGPNGVTPIAIAPLSPYTFNLLEYIDSVKEGRTGVNSAFQGLDADTLAKTATGVNQLVSAAQSRIELIARIFAETGVKDLFRKILKLSAQYQQQQQMIRLRDTFVPVDPRAWKTQYDMQVNVGLGNGNKDQIAGHIMNIMNVQKEAMQGGLPIVGPKQIYNAASKLVNNTGFKNGDDFFVDPDSPQGQQMMQQHAQQPNPAMMKIQADTQMKGAEIQANTQVEGAKIQSHQQMHADKMAMEIQKAHNDMAIQKYKIDQEQKTELEKHKMSLTHQAFLHGADHSQKQAEMNEARSDS